MPLISRRAYAELRGVSEKAVRKAIAAGKIPVVDGQIDPAMADASWARNRDGGQQSKMADAGVSGPDLQTRVTDPSNVLPPPPPPPDGGILQPPASSPSQPEFELAPLTAARIRNTEESTAIKEITRRKLEGGLLESEEVDRSWGEMVQVLKDRLRMLPDDEDLVAALLKCKEHAEIRSLLMRGVMGALAAMTKGIEGMAA